jgi:hypothetical protein
LYVRQAQDTQLIGYANEIRARAERKCRELLAGMEKAKPPGDNQYSKMDRFQNSTGAKTEHPPSRGNMRMISPLSNEKPLGLNGCRLEPKPPTLAEQGITKKQSRLKKQLFF